MNEGAATVAGNTNGNGGNGNGIERRADFWARMFSKVGFPTAVAIALGWGIWHSLASTAGWIRPIVEKQLDANANLQQKLIVSLDAQEELLAQQNVILEKIVDIERQQLERLSRLERREPP